VNQYRDTLALKVTALALLAWVVVIVLGVLFISGGLR